MSGVMRHIKDNQMYWDDANDETVGIEAEVEVDVGGWGMQ